MEGRVGIEREREREMVIQFNNQKVPSRTILRFLLRDRLMLELRSEAICCSLLLN